MIELISNGIDEYILDCIKKSNNEITIISPFVKTDALFFFEPALTKGKRIHLITRLFERDFIMGVSDIDALVKFREMGGIVYGISKKLHAKLFLFDDIQAIVGSSNLTCSGLMANYELNLHIRNEPELIKQFNTYSNQFKKKITSLEKLIQIKSRVDKHILSASGSIQIPGDLQDHGNNLSNDISIKKSRKKRVKKVVLDMPRKWIKFSWSRREPADLETNMGENADYSGSITFPSKPGRPSQIHQNDKIIHVALLKNIMGFDDWIIFGDAEIAVECRENYDKLSDSLIKKYPEIGQYPYVMWLKNVSIINSILANGISLNEMFDELGDDTFIWSKNEAIEGRPGRCKEAIRYYRSHIELTEEGYDRIMEKLEEKYLLLGKRFIPIGEKVWWNEFLPEDKQFIKYVKLSYAES